MSKQSKKLKPELPDEVLNRLVNIILGIDDVKKACNVIFSKEDMKQNNAVKKYLDNKMGDQLRTYIYSKKCSKLKQDLEESLNETDLLSIFRSVLKLKQYKLMGTRDNNFDFIRHFILDVQ